MAAVLLVVLLPVAIAGMALVLNYVYLVLVHRDMQHRGDLIALAAVAELLDENVLMELPGDQSDDAADAELAVFQLVMENNAAGPAALEIALGDLAVTPGYIADLSQPVAGANFDPHPPYNALRLEIERSTSTANPVALLMKSFSGPEEANVRAASYAVLDNRLIGFRPAPSVAAPVVPLAIEADAWYVDRIAQADDQYPPGGNGRKELVVRLTAAPSGDPPAANAALVGLGGSLPSLSTLRRQIVDGVEPGDLPGGELGPADGMNPLLLPAAAQTSAAATTALLVQDFLTVAASDDPRRIFPIYGSFAGNEVDLIGFVAATVLDARDGGSGGDHRLEVVVEPAFLVHFTAWTDPSAAENPYIHKVRLAR